jgi:dienelactone hydrolase
MNPDDGLDTLVYSLKRYHHNTPRMAFPAGDAATWQEKARAQLIERIALPLGNRVPLEPKYGEPVRRTGHTRTPVTFATRDDLSAFGYLLIPDGLKAPVPVVICLPGHGRGAEDLVGIAEDGSDRDHDDGYQHDFAVQCVRNGYAALALELMGFGHRREPGSHKAGASVSSCQTASCAALMLGESMVGWRVWDTMRSIDLVSSRPEIDPNRVALMGISGGGTVALYAAAVDQRVKAAVLSCSYCTFKDSIYSVPHCIDNFVPGILRDFEVADITGLIAPRYLIAESGLDDHIFPEVGVRAAWRESERIYAALGAPKNLSHAFFPAGHVFHGDAAFAKLHQWL